MFAFVYWWPPEAINHQAPYPGKLTAYDENPVKLTALARSGGFL
jgi:hypothetical protein